MLFFDIAVYWHRVYALYVDAILKYGGPLSGATHQLHDAHTCYLGNWLREAATRHADVPEFQELKRCHDAFHHLTDQALSEVDTKRSNSAWLTQTADSLHEASFKVIDAIARLDDVLHPPECQTENPAVEACPIAKYKVGVPIIDEQHEALAALARLTDE